jgi:60 kDa SS-A/Ro ribonucleoprotein
MSVYESGKGVKGSKTWTPVRQVIEALDTAFYDSFGNVEKTDKRYLLGLDVSSSMHGYKIAGSAISAAQATAAMALVTAAVEPNVQMVAFSHRLVDVKIKPNQRLDEVMRTLKNIPFGGTDCSLPMRHAINNKLDVDSFVVYTDCETGFARQASTYLNEYRQKSGIYARSIVVGMTSGGFTIADPNDAGMLDVVGFDTATPNLIADFSCGWI